MNNCKNFLKLLLKKDSIIYEYYCKLLIQTILLTSSLVQDCLVA